MSTISIYLTNLGRYNEGYLIGQWVELPIEEVKLKKVFADIGINKSYEEWFITDFEIEISGIGDVIGEYSDLHLLNELSEKIEELSDFDKEKLEAILEVQAVTDVNSVIDIINNLNNWDLLSDINTEEDLGYYYADECCLIDIPDNLKYYFDYNAYGRDINMDGMGDFTEHGYLIHN